MRWKVVLPGIVGALVVASCAASVSGGPKDGGLVPCAPDGGCPEGTVCAGGYCQPSGDGGVDGPQVGTMRVSPAELDFGTPCVGGEYTASFTITNVGAGDLTVLSLNLIEDRTSGAFMLRSRAVPFIIEAGEAELVTVTLKPNDTDLPTGRVTIQSDDPSPATTSATVMLVSRAKGTPFLGVCVENPYPPPGCIVTTDNAPLLDFATVNYGTSKERVVVLKNIGDGNLPIEVSAVGLTHSTHFVLRLFEAVPDPANPGQKMEIPVTLPFLLSAGDPAAEPPIAATELRIRLRFEAIGIDGDVPRESLIITHTFDGSPTVIPITGKINGCIPVAMDGGVPDGGGDPMNDPNNCGTCGQVCVTPNGTPGCVQGFCVIAACNAGWKDCNGQVSDGCERHILTDPDHCGECDRPCSGNNMATRTCQNGVCNGSCSQGFLDCNGDKLTDGCEVNPSNDPDNCGGCRAVCSSNNMATRTCQNGTCNGTCASVFLDCNGDKLADGCEVDPRSDATHCGSCAVNCAAPLPSRATGAVCQSGQCRVSSCQGGFYDQNGVFADGCECSPTDSVGDACASASEYTAPVTSTGNNLMGPGDVDWFKFTFTTNGTCILPKIALMNADPAVVFDVYTDCSSSGAPCPNRPGGAVGVKTWEVTYQDCGDMRPIDPVPATGTFWQLPLIYYVKVYASGLSSTCLPYTLVVTQ